MIDLVLEVARTSAFAFSVLFCLLLPLTHVGHVYRHRKQLTSSVDLIFFPLLHSVRHTTFQIVSWALWGVSTAVTFPVGLSYIEKWWHQSGSLRALGDAWHGLPLLPPLISPAYVPAASGMAAALSFMGQLFMLKSLLVFDARNRAQLVGLPSQHQRHQRQSGHGRQGGKLQRANRGTGGCKTSNGRRKTRAVSNVGGEEVTAPDQLNPGLASLLVTLMGVALAVVGCLVLLSLEHMPDTPTRLAYCALALACLAVGASSTHGLGGHLRYSMQHARGEPASAGARHRRGGKSCRPADEQAGEREGLWGGANGSEEPGAEEEVEGDPEDDDGALPKWRFFQPFSGGRVFVATQALGWTLFSATVLVLLALAKQLLAGVGYCLRCWALAAGALMMATQLVLGISLLTFQNRRRARRLLQPVMRHPREFLAQVAGLVMPVVLMYLPMHLSCAAVAVLFATFPTAVAGGALAAFLVPYFAFTLGGHPAHTGSRRWEWLCCWFTSAVEQSLAWWTGQLLVVRDWPHDTADQYADELEAAAAATGADTSVRVADVGSACGSSAGRRFQPLARVATSVTVVSCQMQRGSVQAVVEVAGRSAKVAKADETAGREDAAEGYVGQPLNAPLPALQATSGHSGGRHATQQHRRYMLGFHPHGLYPTGAGFVPLMPSVQALFPSTLPLVTLTASIVHYTPGIREIAGWAGFRQVNRATVRKALRDTGGVLLCPGGQAELVFADRALPPRGSAAAAAAASGAALHPPLPLPDGAAWCACRHDGSAPLLPACAVGAPASKPGEQGAYGQRTKRLANIGPLRAPMGSGANSDGAANQNGTVQQLKQQAGDQEATPRPSASLDGGGASGSRPHQFVVYAGHQGFVRLALEEGAWLVPVLALGEVLQLRNAISAPEMQRAAYKRLGFPIPFVLCGRWGVTTLPLRNPLIYVLGKPLQPPAGWEAERQRQLQGAVAHHLCPTSPAASPSRRRASSTGTAAAGSPSAHRRIDKQLRQDQRPWWSRLLGGGRVKGGEQQGVRRASFSAGSSVTHGSASAPVSVPQGVVDEYHAAFYLALEELWERYRHLHPVLRHAELVVEWGSGRHAPPEQLRPLLERRSGGGKKGV